MEYTWVSGFCAHFAGGGCSGGGGCGGVGGGGNSCRGCCI